MKPMIETTNSITNQYLHKLGTRIHCTYIKKQKKKKVIQRLVAPLKSMPYLMILNK